MYAYLDDGPYAGEALRIDPERDGRPPRAIELADADGTMLTFELLGPHHNAEWWIYRRSRGEPH